VTVAEPSIQYDPVGVAEILRTKSLAVPTYQRSYSWITEGKLGSATGTADDKFQVVEFWEDLQSSFSSQDAYFLGTVVLADGPDGRAMVIDGQQRLATASLLIAAIRDRCFAGGENEAGKATQQRYLGRYDKVAKKDLPTLLMNTEDHDFYERRVIQRETTLSATGYSQRLIEKAYGYLVERVEEFAKAQGSNWEPKLTELESWLDKSVKVVAITVPSEADAFLIFETLNDRGADLTIADLLKNFLFSRAGARLPEVQKNWTLTLANLGLNEVGNQLFTKFARHLLSSKYGLVRERDVYKRLKGIIKDPATAVQFTIELEATSKVYYALMYADSDFWSDYSPSTAEAAAVVASLQIERYRPLVLAVLSTFPKPEAEKFMVTLVSWSVRMLCAGSLGGGVAEAAFCEAAVDIRAKKVKTTAEILSKTKVGALVPADERFQADFKDWQPIAKISRYLLRALELTHRNESEPELVVNANTDSVNLEHILPKNAKAADWPCFTAETRKSMVGFVGNHALLQRTKNSRIGNKPWAIKQPILEQSALQLTSETATAKDWTETEIRDRQKVLAALALTCWPREPKP